MTNRTAKKPNAPTLRKSLFSGALINFRLRNGDFFRDATGLFAHASRSMKLLKIKFQRDAVWPFLLAGTITWCSGYPATLPQVELFSVDKIGHFGLYGALATAIVRYPSLARLPWLRLWWAFPLASAYGLGDEFRQSLTVFRTFEWDDWLADSLGAATAVTFYLRWGWYCRLLETPLFQRRPKSVAEVPNDE